MHNLIQHISSLDKVHKNIFIMWRGPLKYLSYKSYQMVKQFFIVLRNPPPSFYFIPNGVVWSHHAIQFSSNFQSTCLRRLIGIYNWFSINEPIHYIIVWEKVIVMSQFSLESPLKIWCTSDFQLNFRVCFGHTMQF